MFSTDTRDREREREKEREGVKNALSRAGKYQDAEKRLIAKYRAYSRVLERLVWLKRENNVLIRSVIVLCVSIRGSESCNVSRW